MNKQELFNKTLEAKKSMQLALDHIQATKHNDGEYERGMRNAFSDCVRWIDELYSETDEPKKVVVPKFVAEWIEEHCYMGKYVCLETFMCQYNDVDLPAELYNYYDNNRDNARDKVISAILNGYEVEKEQLYYVKIPVVTWNDDSSELETEHAYLILNVTSDETRLSHSNKDYGYWKARLTELDIKSIDERYWAFAVKVED